MIMVIGQASSGKSMYAEEMATLKAAEYRCEKVYLATMESETTASKSRIEKHRKMREGKGFSTIEEMYDVKLCTLRVNDKLVLLECMSNLCANVLYKECGDALATDENIEKMADAVFNDVMILADSVKELIIVSVDIFSDGIIYDDWTECYLKLLAKVNRKIACKCDHVYEVVAGISTKVM